MPVMIIRLIRITLHAVIYTNITKPLITCRLKWLKSDLIYLQF